MTDLWKEHDMPSADDPSETLEDSMARLTSAIDAHVIRLMRIRDILRVFYLAPRSVSSVAPILALCEELNPGLRVELEMLRQDDEILTPSTSPF